MGIELRKQLGEKIYELRCERGLTHEELCGDEELLRVRQLYRIERGEALPNIELIHFIAEQLNVPVAHLVDIHKLQLPQAYLDLKEKATKLNIYGDSERIKEMEEMLSSIYEHYFDDLPEEEQLVVASMETGIDLRNQTNNFVISQDMLVEYLKKLEYKNRYNINDLYIIHLAFGYELHIPFIREQFTLFKTIGYKLLTNTSNFPENKYILLNCYVCFISTLFRKKEYSECVEYIDKVLHIIERHNFFHKKPILLMLQAKCYLAKEEVEIAKNYYQQPLAGAEFIGDKVLVKNLQMEMEKDLKHRIK